MLSSLLVVSTLAAVTVAVLLFTWLQKQAASYRQLDSTHQQLAREYQDFKTRFQVVIDAEAERQRVLDGLEGEKARILQALEQERAQIKTETAAALEEKRRVVDSLESAKWDARAQVEAEAQSRRAELDAERIRLEGFVAQIRANQQEALGELAAIRKQGETEKFNLDLSISKLREDFRALDEEANLQSFGFYKPRYNFVSSERYQSKLDDIRSRQKEMIQDKKAAVCHAEWTVNDSRAEGRKQTNRTLKLILRAFNGECDAAIAKVKYNNIHVMETRIRKAHEAINGLVEVQRAEIVWDYLSLKLEELYLVHEYQEKIQEEKEEQRRIREQMREEEIALRELERAKVEAEKEEQRYAEALRKATEQAERAVGEKQQKLLWQVEELKRRLDEAHTNKERAIARAQMTRSGHVYVISNVGSFGEDVYKIGMTRRLDPMDRVKELGDASVPFAFDVHAIIYTEDAPALENKLHRRFHQRRVNPINERKEFFRVGIDEIARAVKEDHGSIDIVMDAEAVEYRKTLAMLQAGQHVASGAAPPQAELSAV
jgi:hypothetical protein